MFERKDDIQFLLDYLRQLQEQLEHYNRMSYRPDFDRFTLPPITSDDKEAARIAKTVDINGDIFFGFIEHYPDDTRYQRWSNVIRLLIKKYRTTIKIIEKIFVSEQQTQLLPNHYIACARIGKLIGKRSEVIAKSLLRAKKTVVKVNRKYYCDPEDVKPLYPKWRIYMKDHPDM